MPKKRLASNERCVGDGAADQPASEIKVYSRSPVNADVRLLRSCSTGMMNLTKARTGSATG